jgi:cell wall-associated NlpC family hydrolase
MVIKANASYPFATTVFDDDKADAIVKKCRELGVRYGFGAKAPTLNSAVDALVKNGIDCSGFFRYLMYHCASGLVVPDGSWTQMEWLKEMGFKESSVESAKLKDGVVRVAVLSQGDSSSGIGHIAIVVDGRTLESHGSVGPNRREWTGGGWQAKAHVYALTRP